MHSELGVGQLETTQPEQDAVFRECFQQHFCGSSSCLAPRFVNINDESEVERLFAHSKTKPKIIHKNKFSFPARRSRDGKVKRESHLQCAKCTVKKGANFCGCQRRRFDIWVHFFHCAVELHICKSVNQTRCTQCSQCRLGRKQRKKTKVRYERVRGARGEVLHKKYINVYRFRLSLSL